MESVFVTENPINIEFFVNESHEVPKLKIGEIFRLKDSSLSIVCIDCLQEFQYFTEFALHIQEHYMRNEDAQLKEIINDVVESKCTYDESYNVQQTNSPRNASIDDGGCEIFDAGLSPHVEWTGRKSYSNELENLPEPHHFIEGTDYQRINDTFRCLACPHESNGWDLFRHHLQTHSKETNVVCPICSKAFTAVSYVRKHVNRKHKTKITADQIREAQPSFRVDNSTARSLETKSFVEGQDYEKCNGRFKCLTCGREMLDRIKEHLLTHLNDRNIYCPLCSKPFIAVSYVRKHVNRAHKMKITANEIKAAQNPIDSIEQNRNPVDNPLQYSFETVMLPTQPEIAEKYFECYHCHRLFTSVSSLRIHLKLHSNVKYSCPYCEKLFALRSYVRDHIVAMHGIRRDEIPRDCIREANGQETPPLPPAIGQPSVGSMFECNLCNNLYNSRQSLRQHMKTHSENSSLLCVICGSVFKSIANLRYHMERHQADPNKRHQCLHEQCNKTYPTRRYMLNHYRTIHLNRRKVKTTAEASEIAMRQHKIEASG